MPAPHNAGHRSTDASGAMLFGGVSFWTHGMESRFAAITAGIVGHVAFAALRGAARNLDLAGVLIRRQRSCDAAAEDAAAMRADWVAVGEDLRGAIESFERQHRQVLGGAR